MHVEVSRYNMVLSVCTRLLHFFAKNAPLIGPLIVKKGVGIIQPDGKGGTPLHYVDSHAGVFILLKAAPHLLEARDHQGRTPLLATVPHLLLKVSLRIDRGWCRRECKGLQW